MYICGCTYFDPLCCSPLQGGPRLYSHTESLTFQNLHCYLDRWISTYNTYQGGFNCPDYMDLGHPARKMIRNILQCQRCRSSFSPGLPAAFSLSLCAALCLPGCLVLGLVLRRRRRPSTSSIGRRHSCETFCLLIRSKTMTLLGSAQQKISLKGQYLSKSMWPS